MAVKDKHITKVIDVCEGAVDTNIVLVSPVMPVIHISDQLFSSDLLLSLSFIILLSR